MLPWASLAVIVRLSASPALGVVVAAATTNSAAAPGTTQPVLPPPLTLSLATMGVPILVLSATETKLTSLPPSRSINQGVPGTDETRLSRLEPSFPSRESVPSTVCVSPAPNVSVSAEPTRLTKLSKVVSPATVCAGPTSSTVPPFATKPDPASETKSPPNEAFPEGAVKWAPGLSANPPLTVNGPYDPKSCVPLTVKAPAFKPENPDSSPLLSKVSIPDVVNTPEPDRVPSSAIDPPLPALGAAPRGRLQVLPTVLVPAVLEKVTRLKAALPQEIAALSLPSKTAVLPLVLKVALRLTPKLPANVSEPVLAH